MAVKAPVKPAKPAIVWQEADKLLLKLSGRAFLDVGDPDDQQFFAGLELGTDVTLMVTGRVVAAAASANFDHGDEFVGFTGSRSISLHTVTPAE